MILKISLSNSYKVREIDEDGSGEIEFGEFKTLLKTSYGSEWYFIMYLLSQNL